MSSQPFSALPKLTRRGLLLTAGAFTAWTMVPRFASAAPARDPRYLSIVLRGAADGLAVVEPSFDPAYAGLRGPLALGASGNEAGLPLGNGFQLNPRLPVLHGLYAEGHALLFHAIASPYRDRSHFDGQDVIESGQPGPRLAAAGGWLNRALSALPGHGEARGGIAIGSTVPLIMRGKAPTKTWTPSQGDPAPEDARRRLLSYYKSSSPILANSFAQGLELDDFAARAMAEADTREKGGFNQGMRMIGTLLADPNGPRIGSIDLNGWDTHTEERPTGSSLGKTLARLDEGLGTLRQGLGKAWDQTVVSVITEFGRTVRVNGSRGTDHGTATVAILVGGAVKGGRVIADWPGLGQGALYADRDLKPTADLRAMLKGVLREHLGLEGSVLARSIFPDSDAVKPMDGLIV